MNIILSTLPHTSQRYDTCGDWITDGRGHLRHVCVSEMGNEDYHFLVGIHELIEAYLCLKRGITQEAVDAFDIHFEERRVEGNTDEPGHDPAAPYHREHVFAEMIERLLADELGVDWDHYDQTVTAL